MLFRSREMYEYKVADDVVKEDDWTDEDAKKRNFLRLDKIVQYHLLKLMDLSEEDIVESRKEKYFKMGEINGIRN